jgi:hypothetical protein
LKRMRAVSDMVEYSIRLTDRSLRENGAEGSGGAASARR